MVELSVAGANYCPETYIISMLVVRHLLTTVLTEAVLVDNSQKMCKFVPA